MEPLQFACRGMRAISDEEAVRRAIVRTGHVSFAHEPRAGALVGSTGWSPKPDTTIRIIGRRAGRGADLEST